MIAHLWKDTFLISLQTTNVYVFSTGRTLSLHLTRSPNATGTRLTARMCWWARRLLSTARTARKLRAARGAGSSLLHTVRRGVFSSRTHCSGAGPCPQSQLWLLKSLPDPLHEQRSMTLSGKSEMLSSPQTCWHRLCLHLGSRPIFFFLLLLSKGQSKSFWIQFWGKKKQKQKKRKTKQKKQLFLSTEETFWYQMTIFHVCKAWFMFLIVICCITKHWKFHKPFAICSFVLYCLFYASPVDNCV